MPLDVSNVNPNDIIQASMYNNIYGRNSGGSSGNRGNFRDDYVLGNRELSYGSSRIRYYQVVADITREAKLVVVIRGTTLGTEISIQRRFIIQTSNTMNRPCLAFTHYYRHSAVVVRSIFATSGCAFCHRLRLFSGGSRVMQMAVLVLSRDCHFRM